MFIKVSTLEPKVYTNGCNNNWGKVRKVDQLLNFWSFYHYLGVVLHDTPGLILFIGGYLRLNGIFVTLVEFDGPMVTYLPPTFALIVILFSKRSKQFSWMCFRC